MAIVQFFYRYFLLQWKPVIRTSSGVEKHVLIKGKINRETYRNVSSEDVLISGVLITGFHCIIHCLVIRSHSNNTVFSVFINCVQACRGFL